MKKAAVILFVLTILYPVGAALAACLGYRLEPVSVSFYAFLIGVLSVCVLVLDRKQGSTDGHSVISVLITPFSLVNAALCMITCPEIPVIICVLLSVGCCFFLTARYGKPVVMKNIALVLSLLMALPISFLGYILLIFGNLGQNTVVQTVESPSGTYYAEVIDSDQGALGGDTFVDVHSKDRLHAVLFTIEEKPQRVYIGNWGEFETMQIHWEDDDCLVINGVEYEIAP